MNKIYSIILISVFLTACGGGGDDDFVENTITDIQGDWITDCRTSSNGSSSIISYTFDTSNQGNDFFVSGFSSYDTNNCSGSSDITLLAGDIFYSGEEATSVCIAEKIDLFVTSADDGIDEFEGSDLDEFLADEGLSGSDFDIACVPNDVLFLGLNDATLDGSSNSRRPTQMNTSLVFNATNFGASRAATDQVSSLEIAKARVRNMLKKAASE